MRALADRLLDWLRAHALLVVAIAIAVLALLSSTALLRASAFRRDQAATVAELRAQSLVLDRVRATSEARRDTVQRLRRERDDAVQQAARHAARAESFLAGLTRRTAALNTAPDTARGTTMVPREWFTEAMAAATEYRLAYVAADSARRVEEARTALLARSVDEVTAELARVRDRVPDVIRVLERSEAPCRVLVFSCPSRTTAFVAGAVATGAFVLLTKRGF